MSGERLEQLDFFTYLGSDVRKDGDCRCEVMSRLALGTVVMINKTMEK